MNFKKLSVLGLLLIMAFTPAFVSAQGATSMGEFVELQVGDQQVVVHLISQATDLAGIGVTAMDMGTLIGVETFDTAGRYLPAVNILPKSPDGRLILKLAQTPRADGYRIRQIGSANVAPFWTSFMGTTTPEQLHVLLATQYMQGTGLNLLLPAEASGQLAVFRTPLSATALVVPGDLLPDPQNRPPTLDVPALVLMQVADLTQSPYVYLNKARTAQAPNLIGFSTPKSGVADALDLATAPLGFRYATSVVFCANQFGAVIQQTPAPGTSINPFIDTIQLTVCDPFLRAVAQVRNVGYLRSTPMLASATITRSISPGTALTVIGRTANNAWVQVNLIDGGQGWLSVQSVQLDGDVNTLQVVDIPFGALLSDQMQISAGQCVMVSWRVENAIRVLYKGIDVQASGGILECPLQTSTYVLRAIGNDRQAYNTLLTIRVVRQGY